MRQWLFRWGPAVLFMGIIFMASSTAGSEIPDFGSLNLFVMKGGHLTGYALLGAAFLHAATGSAPMKRSGIAVAGILVVLYAISDEWHQNFTPGRRPSARDIFIDGAGGFLGIAFLYHFRKHFRRSPGQRH